MSVYSKLSTVNSRSLFLFRADSLEPIFPEAEPFTTKEIIKSVNYLILVPFETVFRVVGRSLGLSAFKYKYPGSDKSLFGSVQPPPSLHSHPCPSNQEHSLEIYEYL